MTVTTEILSERVDLGSRTWRPHSDSLSRVTITVDDPGTSLELGMHSASTGPIGREFFAIDNVEVRAN